MTDAELDALVGNLKYENSVLSDGRAKTALEAAGAITYIRSTLKAVLQREAETYARHDAKVEVLEAQLAERDALGAVVMRERAADVLDSAATELECDASRFRGGTDPHHYRMNSSKEALKHSAVIRALPLPTHAELLAHALQLPEIKAMTTRAAPVVTDAMERTIGNVLDDFFKPSEYLMVNAIRAALTAALAQMEGK